MCTLDLAKTNNIRSIIYFPSIHSMMAWFVLLLVLIAQLNFALKKNPAKALTEEMSKLIDIFPRFITPAKDYI